jgi:hypothetical protein
VGGGWWVVGGGWWVVESYERFWPGDRKRYTRRLSLPCLIYVQTDVSVCGALIATRWIDLTPLIVQEEDA